MEQKPPTEVSLASASPWIGRLLELTGILLIAAIAVAYQLMYFNRGIKLLDDGFQLTLASRILRGEVIYRDFTVLAAPFSFYLTAGLLEWFGMQMVVLRWACLVTGTALTVVMVLAGRRLMPWPFAAAAAFCSLAWGWMLTISNLYTWLGVLTAMLPLLFYLNWLRARRGVWMILAGLSAALAGYTKQTTGALALLALILAYLVQVVVENRISGTPDSDTSGEPRSSLLRRHKPLWLLLASTAVPGFLVLFLLLATAGPAALLENWWHYSREIYPKAMGYEYPSFYPITFRWAGLADVVQGFLSGRWTFLDAYLVAMKLMSFALLLLLPMGLLRLGYLWRSLRRSRASQFSEETDGQARREAEALLPLLLFCSLEYLQAWPRSDETHIIIAFQPSFLLLAYLLFCGWRSAVALVARLRERMSGSSENPRAVLEALSGLAMAGLLAAALAPLAGFIYAGSTRTGFWHGSGVFPFRAERLEGMYADRDAVERVDGIVLAIQRRTSPGEPIFVVPASAGLYFLTDRSNPTRYDLVYDHVVDEATNAAVLAELDRARPRLVIRGYDDIDDRLFKDYARPLQDYLDQNYTTVEKLPMYDVLERK